jgi:DNA-directed RNA polymerase specialized sigma24 family protein
MKQEPHDPAHPDAASAAATASITGTSTATTAAFDALYRAEAPELLRLAHLLTGRAARARRSVLHAFEQAWEHWAEVSAQDSPLSWIRTAACDHALSPWWFGGGPRRVHYLHLAEPLREQPEQPQPDGAPATPQRDLLRALHRLPRTRRRALILHEAAGLDFLETACEVESSTPAAQGRVLAARAELAVTVPEIVGADPLDPGFAERLRTELRAAAELVDTGLLPTARQVRGAAGRQATLRTGAAAGAVLAVLTAIGVVCGVNAGRVVPGPAREDPREQEVAATAEHRAEPAGPPAAGPPAARFGSGSGSAPPRPWPEPAPNPRGPAVGYGRAVTSRMLADPRWLDAAGTRPPAGPNTGRLPTGASPLFPAHLHRKPQPPASGLRAAADATSGSEPGPVR